MSNVVAPGAKHLGSTLDDFAERAVQGIADADWPMGRFEHELHRAGDPRATQMQSLLERFRALQSDLIHLTELKGPDDGETSPGQTTDSHMEADR